MEPCSGLKGTVSIDTWVFLKFIPKNSGLSFQAVKNVVVFHQIFPSLSLMPDLYKIQSSILILRLNTSTFDHVVVLRKSNHNAQSVELGTTGFERLSSILVREFMPGIKRRQFYTLKRQQNFKLIKPIKFIFYCLIRVAIVKCWLYHNFSKTSGHQPLSARRQRGEDDQSPAECPPRCRWCRLGRWYKYNRYDQGGSSTQLEKVKNEKTKTWQEMKLSTALIASVAAIDVKTLMNQNDDDRKVPDRHPLQRLWRLYQFSEEIIQVRIIFKIQN